MSGVFKLRIELGNDAMRAYPHVADALEGVADRLRGGSVSGTIRDENGNPVGTYEFTEER